MSDTAMSTARRVFLGAAIVLGLLLAWSAVTMAQTAPAKKPAPDLSGFKPTVTETMLLPQYCWGQFDARLQGPGMQAYNLPPREVCGERMNHFCPALVSLARAKKDPKMRGYWIDVANGHIDYTLKALREVPKCPLGSEIERYAIEIKAMRASAPR
jgi:hypothetical protein